MYRDKPSDTMQHVTAHDSATWQVVCLCAAWCGVCRQYESEFLAIQAAFPQIRFVWVDVEDQEEIMGDVDVETFPTLLIGQGAEPLFFGPVLPQVKVLERLLASLLQAPQKASSMSPEAVPLWQRITAQ